MVAVSEDRIGDNSAIESRLGKFVINCRLGSVEVVCRGLGRPVKYSIRNLMKENGQNGP